MQPNDILRGRLDELRLAIVDSQRKISSAHQQVKALSVTTYSPDRSVSVVVSGTGVVQRIDFHDDDYRDLDPAELSALLVELLARAQNDVRARVIELMPPAPFTGITPAQLLDPETDPESLLPQDFMHDLFDTSRPQTQEG